MSGSFHSRQSNFDNPNYFSDGRDRTGYTNQPRLSSDAAVTDHGLILQPNRLKHFAKDANTVYSYRPGQDNIYAYSNAAFSDISRPSYRSSSPNFYSPNKPFRRPSVTHQARSFCSKYWYIFALVTLAIVIAIGITIAIILIRSRNSEFQCSLSCDPSEKLVQINATHCECQFVNECEFEQPICQQFPCIKFAGVGYECNCTQGYQHPPMNNDLTVCEDIDECTSPGICGANQLCNNTIGSYHCFCRDGYETVVTNGQITCPDKNECADGTKCLNGQCINTDGSFRCVCNPGFIIDALRPSFCEDFNECLSSHPCTGDNEICNNTIGSYRCLCASGYQRDGENRCINIDECSRSTTVCDKNSRCEDRNGTFACCIASISDRCLECGYEYGGTRIPNGTGKRRKRMVNGDSVEFGQFPWVAALLIKPIYYDHESRYVCAASLVSSWNLITAAHCLDEQHFRKTWSLNAEPNSFKDIFEIRIGAYNISVNSSEVQQTRSYSIDSFTLHPEYQTLANEDAIVRNDIAVIRLTERIERSASHDWICLNNFLMIGDQQSLDVVSYSHYNDDLFVQNRLNVRVLNNENTRRECLRQLSDVAEDAFCTFSTKPSAFLGAGDSGAGAMLSINADQWHLSGIMSKQGVPQRTFSAMTNVSVHLDWLKSLIER